MPHRARVLLVPLLLALILVPLPAGGHPLAHPGAPRITNLRPAPGEVVPAGTVAIAALAVAGQDVAEHQLSVDGSPVASTRGAGSHPTVTAAPDLAPGDHIAQVRVTDTAGRTTTRAWRFTVSALDVRRLAGTGRIETAGAVSRDLYPRAGSAPAAVLARADDYADALAGVPLAVVEDGPLLLSASDELSEGTASELRRAVAPGGRVTLLGGAAALSPTVEAQVAALGFVPRRLEGASRYATAVAIADALPPAPAAVLVSGVAFADALAASAPAAVRGWPILLTVPDRLPPEVADAIQRRGVTDVVVVGGERAVGGRVTEQVEGLGATVERLAGPGRYDTAARVVARFTSSATQAAVASGERFPDALAGARHAAGHDMPLLLSAPGALHEPQAAQVRDLGIAALTVYGGTAAVGERAVGDAHRAWVDRVGPRLVAGHPLGGGEVTTLDQVVMEFDREVVVEHSVLYVTIGGHEVAGSLDQGEFPTMFVFAAEELPSTIVAGQRYELRVTGAVYDGQSFTHVDHRLAYRKLDLSRGDSGPLVADLQQRLGARGYWLGAPDGLYGTLTHQAVIAFQKVQGLTPDGVYGASTRSALEGQPRAPQARSTQGRVIEVDLERQVLMAVLDGQVQFVFNTSTGHGRTYQFEGSTYRATTTTGQRRITRQIDGMREAERGQLWRPKYFDDTRGIAIHGSTSVPSYPASAGCVRLTYAAMDFIWDSGMAPVGTPVWVYPEAYYA